MSQVLAPRRSVPVSTVGRRSTFTIRFTTFLAPNMLPVYRFVAWYVGEKLGCRTELSAGGSYDEVAHADVAFLCGLPYVEIVNRHGPIVEPLAAPVLEGERHAGQPICFSDVIVHRDSPFRSFADLRGRSWCYNEPHSQSGYGITRYHLASLGETAGYFGRVVEAGWHERSIGLIASGEVDASAIDSQVLEVALREHPELAARLRIIDTLGPSPIQPIVTAQRLPEPLKADLRAVLLEMGDDATARPFLTHGMVARFTVVNDASYDPIRAMAAVAEAAGCLTLR